MTPEGRIKKLVTSVLKTAPGSIYYYMPVPNGFGESSLDYLGGYYGHFFAVETKKPGGEPTNRQNQIISRMRAAGCKVFVIDGPDGVEELRLWLLSIYGFSTREQSPQ